MFAVRLDLANVIAPQPPYIIQVIKDPDDLIHLTVAQHGAFVNTGNVLHDTLFPPAHSPNEEQIKTAARRDQSTFASDPKHSVFVKAVDAATALGMQSGASILRYQIDLSTSRSIEWMTVRHKVS